MNRYEYFLVTNADLQQVDIRLLLELRDSVNPDRTFRWCDGPEAVYADDREGVRQLWIPGEFQVPDFSSQLGEVAGSTSVAMANVDNFMTPWLMDKSMKRDKTVILMEGWFDPTVPTRLAVCSVPLVYAGIETATLARGSVVVRLRAKRRDPATIEHPRRKWFPTCQFAYGGPGCGPKGTMATCSLTPSNTGGCGDANSAVGSPAGGKKGQGRFGGFFIQALGL